MYCKPKLEFPVFNGKETTTQFLRRVEEFNLKIKLEKYNLILEFVNTLVKGNSLVDYKGYASLTDFKNVPASKLTLDNKCSINECAANLARELGIDELDLVRITAREGDIMAITKEDDSEPHTIVFLSKILSLIEYSLISKDIDGEIYYSIKSRPHASASATSRTYKRAQNRLSVNYRL
jgi:hypothetical protein